MENRTYSVVKNERPGTKSINTIVLTGLTYEQARKESDRLQREEDEKHPGRSSWTKALYGPKLEPGPCKVAV